MIDQNTQKILTTLERIRDVILNHGGTHEELDRICNQIDEIYAKLLEPKKPRSENGDEIT
jgi:hypothetical protein